MKLSLSGILLHKLKDTMASFEDNIHSLLQNLNYLEHSASRELSDLNYAIDKGKE